MAWLSLSHMECIVRLGRLVRELGRLLNTYVCMAVGPPVSQFNPFLGISDQQICQLWKFPELTDRQTHKRHIQTGIHVATCGRDAAFAHQGGLCNTLCLLVGHSSRGAVSSVLITDLISTHTLIKSIHIKQALIYTLCTFMSETS